SREKVTLERLEATLKGVAMRIMKPYLAPCIEIARGMKDSQNTLKMNWDALQQKNPAALSTALQGVLTKEEVLENLQFEGISSPVADWVTDWINEMDESKLKNFVYILSGTPALGQGAKITIKRAPISCAFHTCGLELDLNPEWQEIKNEGKVGLYR